MDYAQTRRGLLINLRLSVGVIYCDSMNLEVYAHTHHTSTREPCIAGRLLHCPYLVRVKMNQAGVLLVFGLSFAVLTAADDYKEALDTATVIFPPDPWGQRGPKGSIGPRGRRGLQGKTGERGLKGDIGSMGIEGMTGQTGAKGEPGDNVLNEEELDRIQQMINEAINSLVIEKLASLRCNSCNKTETTEAPNNSSRTLCGIPSEDWRRVAYLDTTQGQTCPPALRTFTNTTTNQKACGTQHTTRHNIPAVSMTFPTNRSYTHVCGRVRGYVYRYGGAFSTYAYARQHTIDSNYADGVSITMGSPRQHLWTYAIGLSETSYDQSNACPCARSDYVASNIPDFVGNHHYCESAFVEEYEPHIAWEDALWDGMNCVTPNNTCCNSFGWFHHEVAPTQDSIEVRWMKYHHSVYTEVMTDQLEIWVM